MVLRRKKYSRPSGQGDQGFQDLATTRLKSSNRVLPFTEQRPVETMEKIAAKRAKDINVIGMSGIEETQNEDEASEWAGTDGLVASEMARTDIPVSSRINSPSNTDVAPNRLKVKEYKLKSAKTIKRGVALQERVKHEKLVGKTKDLRKLAQSKTSLF